MALIATDFTTQIIMLLVGFVFLFGGGFIQKLGATGLFVTGLGLVITSQSYVSDLTSTPANVFLFNPSNIQTALVITFAICSLVSVAQTFLTLRKLIQLTDHPKDETDFQKKKRMNEFFEELV